MAYGLTIVERDDRKSRIAQSADTGRTTRIRFRGQLKDLRQVTIPLDTPLYRTANIRTLVRQARYVSDHGLSEDFFARGQEDLSTQRAQHALLLPLAKADRANIYDVLAEEAEQTEALIVTASGVVLNGNRRLCAMRELFHGDSSKYRRFESVEVAVLPTDTNNDDLAQIETDLQIAPDMRLDYGWVEEALALRRQFRELGWDMAKATLHWREAESELNKRLTMLELAEEYLERRGVPRDYERVASDQQAFERLHANQHSQRNASPSLREARRLIAFACLSNQDEMTGRIYNHVIAVNDVLPRVLTDPGLEIPTQVAPTLPVTDNDDPLSNLPDSPGSGEEAYPLDFLRDIQNWTNVAKAADGAYNAIQEERREGRRTGQFVASSGRINSLAAGLNVRNSAPETLPRAFAQLATAVSLIADRLGEVVDDNPDALSERHQGTLKRAAQKLHQIAET